MEYSNVFDIKTRKNIFGEGVRAQIQEGIKPYLKENAGEAQEVQAVNTIEQVLCTALVSAAIGLAVKLANKIASKITTSQLQPPVTKIG